MTLTAVVAANVRRLRKARGWTAQQLAEEMVGIGVPWDRQVVSKLENGRRRHVTIGELAALAAALNVDPPWSLTGEAPACGVCAGSPPVGFSCLSCGSAG